MIGREVLHDHVRDAAIRIGVVEELLQGLETPAGLYNIENKQTDPYWHVPNSDWAGSLAGQVIPPGPQNPIKARWLGIIGGAGIHGTTDDASIGSNATP